MSGFGLPTPSASAVRVPDGSLALRLILKSADIRSNFVERTGTAARRPLARAVVRAMTRIPWITSSERAFREFVKTLDRDGGGILFEALSDAEADRQMSNCITCQSPS